MFVCMFVRYGRPNGSTDFDEIWFFIRKRPRIKYGINSSLDGNTLQICGKSYLLSWIKYTVRWMFIRYNRNVET